MTFEFFRPALALLVLTVAAGLPSKLIAHTQPCPLSGSAASALLVDATGGNSLYSQNPDQRLQPASLAKIMTLYLAFDSIANGDVSLEEEVEISKNAAEKMGSTMYLREGEKTTLAELIKGIAIVSGNDACIAVAEKLSGSEQAFVHRMNRKLLNLNLSDTRFQTADGWPAEDQYTTARDMAMISLAYMKTHPEALTYHRMKEFSHAGIVLHNRNRLVFKDPSVDGLKTGHTEQAGFHLIATADRHGQRYLAVVMGAQDIQTREKEAMALLEFGFGSFTAVTLFEEGELLFELPVRNGDKKEVGLVADEEGTVTVPVDLKEHIEYEIVSAPWQEAPVESGSGVGRALIICRDEVLKTVSLSADSTVEKAVLPSAPPENESAAPTAANAPATPANSRPPTLVPSRWLTLPNKYLLAAVAAFFAVLLIQTAYILKLRRKISKAGAVDSEIIKRRLEKIVK